MRYLAYLLLPVPVVNAIVATVISRARSPVSQPVWVSTVLIGVGIYIAVAVASLIVMRRQFAGPRGDTLRAAGIDPDSFLILGGTCIFFVPCCVALLLTPAGLRVGHTYAASAFSAVTMLAWVLLYRPIGGASAR